MLSPLTTTFWQSLSLINGYDPRKIFSFCTIRLSCFCISVTRISITCWRCISAQKRKPPWVLLLSRHDSPRKHHGVPKTFACRSLRLPVDNPRALFRSLLIGFLSDHNDFSLNISNTIIAFHFRCCLGPCRHPSTQPASTYVNFPLHFCCRSSSFSLISNSCLISMIRWLGSSTSTWADLHIRMLSSRSCI